MEDEEEDPKHGFTDEEIDNLQEHFRHFDADGSGDIETSELEALMHELGEDPEHEELEALIKEVDADGSGTVDFDEFLHMMDQLMHEHGERHMSKDEERDEAAEAEEAEERKRLLEEQAALNAETAAAQQAVEEMESRATLEALKHAGSTDEGEDELFHADYGVVMTWRLIVGGGAHLGSVGDVAGTKFNARTVQQQREAIHRSALKLTRADPAMKTPFLMIAAPDTTMTLDTLQRHLLPLVNRHPDGALLLLGLPGMPNTHWPRSMNLTSASQGRAVTKLLKNLVKTKQLDPERHLEARRARVLGGRGNGAMSVLQVALTALREEQELRQLRDSTVLFTGINAFAHVDKPLKKATMAFQRLLLRGTYHERLAALAELHFSQNFLMQASQLIKARAGELLVDRRYSRTSALDYRDRGRALVLKNFWATRGSSFWSRGGVPGGAGG